MTTAPDPMRQFSELAGDPAADDPHIRGLIFRSPPELRVHFDPESPR